MPRLFGDGWSMQDDELLNKVDRIVKAINTLGVHQHEAIAIHADISLTGVLMVLASIKMGLRVAICPLREPVSVIENWLKNLGIHKLFFSAPRADFFSTGQSCFSIEELIRVERPALNFNKKPGTQFSSIVRTSGTSDVPKSALIFEEAHRASAYAVNSYFAVTAKSTWALALPLYHVSGLSILFRMLLANASIYIANSYGELVTGLKRNKITHLSLVPTQLRRLLEDRVDLALVKAIIIGGDALSENLRSQIISLGLPVYETYGLTETASMVGVKDCRQKNGGIVLSHAIMRILDDGEILVGGKSLFAGYMNKDVIIRDLTRDGLFATGDVGKASCCNQLPLIVGRKNNRIISGGENIQAEEVERALDAHPSIVESIVIGVKDEKFGMRPCAYIKWVNDPLNNSELYTYLKSKLAPYKIPKSFLLWPKEAPAANKKPRHWFLMNTRPV